MGKIDSRPLKAFVRFDGSGRIVAGSLILRRKKPKVGKWVEIPAYECCNPTTTTTTTASPTTTTTTTTAALCLKYLFSIPDGGVGNLEGIDCDGVVISSPGIPGPIDNAELCARTLTGTGDITLAVVNNCTTPCITYTIIVPDGGSATIIGVDCQGNSFNTPLTGPINAPYCFRNISTAIGDITVNLTGPCDTTTTTTTIP